MIVCKGWCDSKKDTKRPSDPFATSSYCKRCNWWLPKQPKNKSCKIIYFSGYSRI